MAVPSFLRTLALSALFVVPGALRGQEANGSMAGVIRLLPGDAVRLEVGDEPELAGDYPVDGSGTALLPLIGLKRVTDRPFEEVRLELMDAYAKELSRPMVRLTPVFRIAVLGEVNRPGLVSVDPTFSLADVVASAGGLAPTADRDAIHLVRGGERLMTSTADQLTLARTQILSGDQVMVGRQSWFQDNLPIFVGASASVVAALVTALVLR